jgi:hypothetical protein
MSLDNLTDDDLDRLATVLAAADAGAKDAQAWLEGRGRIELVPSEDNADGYEFVFVRWGEVPPAWTGWN